MVPKKPETMEERMYAAEVEMLQLKDELKTFNEAMCSDLDRVRIYGEDTRGMVSQMNTELALMPGKITEAIRADNKAKGMNINSWIGLGCVLVTTLVAVLVALK